MHIDNWSYWWYFIWDFRLGIYLAEKLGGFCGVGTFEASLVELKIEFLHKVRELGWKVVKSDQLLWCYRFSWLSAELLPELRKLLLNMLCSILVVKCHFIQLFNVFCLSTCRKSLVKKLNIFFKDNALIIANVLQ